MQSKNIILTDIIGVYIANNLYTTNPINVLEYFEHLQNLNICIGEDIYFDNEKYQLYAQKRLTSIREKPFDKYDGFIFINQKNEFKYKVPTCDVRIIKTEIYLDSNTIPLNHEKYEGFQDNSIVEIRANANGKYEIIRKRLDRIYPSTKADFQSFVENSKFLSSLNK